MNEELLEAAKKAINEYHGDTSVSQQTTMEGLEELRDDITAMIEAIKHDMKTSGE